MALRPPTTHKSCPADVAFAPTEVDAGTEFTFTITVACPHGCDLSGMLVSVRDESGAEVSSARLGEALEGRHSTGPLTLKAPPQAGAYRLQVTLDATAKKRLVHELQPTTVTVPVRAHAVRVSVWDLPSAVLPGEPFSFMVGVKCSAGCKLSGHTLHLAADEDSEEPTAIAVLGEEPWPGTQALYPARVTATAPVEPGSQAWQIVSPHTADGLPHLAASAPVALKVVQTPDFEVTIQALDKERQSPIKGARIVMHPYRAVSDDDGFARLKVARGEYQILVSGAKHMPARQQVIVASDIFTKAELDREPPPPNPDDMY